MNINRNDKFSSISNDSKKDDLIDNSTIVFSVKGFFNCMRGASQKLLSYAWNNSGTVWTYTMLAFSSSMNARCVISNNGKALSLRKTDTRFGVQEHLGQSQNCWFNPKEICKISPYFKDNRFQNIFTNKEQCRIYKSVDEYRILTRFLKLKQYSNKDFNELFADDQSIGAISAQDVQKLANKNIEFLKKVYYQEHFWTQLLDLGNRGFLNDKQLVAWADLIIGRYKTKCLSLHYMKSKGLKFFPNKALAKYLLNNGHIQRENNNLCDELFNWYANGGEMRDYVLELIKDPKFQKEYSKEVLAYLPKLSEWGMDFDDINDLRIMFGNDPMMKGLKMKLEGNFHGSLRKSREKDVTVVGIIVPRDQAFVENFGTGEGLYSTLSRKMKADKKLRFMIIPEKLVNKAIFKQLNGVIFGGGDDNYTTHRPLSLNEYKKSQRTTPENMYVKAAQLSYKLGIPQWGTCLGHQYTGLIKGGAVYSTAGNVKQFRNWFQVWRDNPQIWSRTKIEAAIRRGESSIKGFSIGHLLGSHLNVFQPGTPMYFALLSPKKKAVAYNRGSEKPLEIGAISGHIYALHDKYPPKGLHVGGRAKSDNCIEGLYKRDSLNVMSNQWNPETIYSNEQLKETQMYDFQRNYIYNS